MRLLHLREVQVPSKGHTANNRHIRDSNPSYAPAPHPMAPPSPSTNSSSNHSSSNSSGEQLSKTNLYIRGLPPGTTDQDLIKLCQPLLSAAWICERGKTEHWKINTYLKAVF
ncbi:hypothetical protein FD754_001112 [Muntiacus muntjak]|uniref:RRM domain-containing protein n=1 Tax=Muntiacus muntjak TaxID=9888 RepID=A0A5N3W9C3_MUNMU|nr:hypothetical protein FD754_001112 [Muntiacus muntjak]